MKLSTFLITLLLVLSSFSAMAQSELQRLSVTPTEAPRTVAVFPDHPDKAAIIFESTLTNLRFDSQMDGIVQIRDESANGRYILIIEPFTQIISITAPGFIQERLRIGTPEPREVRYFSVAPEVRRQDVISVIFNVTPSDARLFVDDQQTDINQTVQIEPGNRAIRIEREGYRSIEEQVTISPANISFAYSLQEIDIVPVQISSTNIGATVTIDGSPRGEIDRSGTRALFMYPDSYSLQLSQAGYISQTIPIQVTESGSNLFALNLTRNIGELILSLNPADANIFLNREEYTGQTQIELSPGRYRLDIEKEYYEPYSETIDIALNQKLNREITLQAHTGTLQFSVTPNDAQVELVSANGQVVNEWSGIQLLRNLKAGQYTLKISAFGHLPKEYQLVILKNEMARVEIQLEEGFQETWERDTITIVLDVQNPITGRLWMDRNLGAYRAATSSTDMLAYGDLYQWGRSADGHQKRNSSTITIRSSSDRPGHGSFILSTSGASWDWRSPQNNNLWQGVNGTNNPCPSGYRLPTEAEWSAERLTWNRSNDFGAYGSPLKLPLAGRRDGSSGMLFFIDSDGFYWSSTVSGSNAGLLAFASSGASMYSLNRASGYSVRCIKD